VIILDLKQKLVIGHVESGNMKTFKLYFENSQIESLEAMIANPDPERVKMYGGTEYVDMLKKKLERAKKSQAIQMHLKKSPLGKGIEEDAQDRCKRKADQVYGKKTSAYKSGAIVRCRKGKIWKKK
jgi:hypothetical protein